MHRIELKGTSMREKKSKMGLLKEPSLRSFTGSLDKALQQVQPFETKDAMKAKLSIFVKPI